MSDNLAALVVRVLAPDGSTMGTGFVVSDNLVVTCAHVVEACGAKPGSQVRLTFLTSGQKVSAQVKSWRTPEAEDIAILRIDGPLPEGVHPATLGRSIGCTDHLFKTLGFPDANPVGGLGGSGKIQNQTTLNSVQVWQLRSQEVTGRFSGGPVLDIELDRIVGMITATIDPDRRRRLGETALMTPIEDIIAACPTLEGN